MNKVLAFLPGHLLHMASRVATRNIYHEALHYIFIQPLNGGVRIISTDSVRVLRITFQNTIWYCRRPILIHRSAFPRPLKSTRFVKIDQLGRRQLGIGQVGVIDDLCKGKTMRSISSDRIELRGNRINQYPYESLDNAWPTLDHQNTVSFDGNCLYDFLEKVKRLADQAVKRLADQAVKRLAGDSEELTDEEVKKLELLAAGVVINVQTRQDNGSLKLIFTAYNGEELKIVLETPIHYEKISFNGAYLLDFLNLVNRYSPSGIITMNINRSTRLGGFLFTATIGPYIHIEYLLMPIVR
jgi:hypothetical protein